MIEHSKTLQAHQDRLEKQSRNNCKLKALLCDCRETIEGLEKATKKLEKHFHQQDAPNRTVAKVTEVERCLDKHDVQLQELEERQKRYSSRLVTLQTKRGAYDNDLSDIRENVEGNRMALEMCNGDMSGVKKDSEVSTERIKLQNETTDALEARLLSYERVFDGIEKEFDRLRREQGERIEQLVRENKRQDERIEQLVKENMWQDEKMRSQGRVLAQQGDMIKKQEMRISGQDNRMILYSEDLVEHNIRAKKQDEKMTQQAKEMQAQAEQIEEQDRTMEEQAEKLAHFECSNWESFLQQDIMMVKQAKEVETQAKQIEEQNRTMEEQVKRLEQLEYTNRQSILELPADLEEQTKAAVSKAGIKLEADLESVKKRVTVSENSPSTPTTGAAELKNLEFQMELVKARLDRHETVNRNLVSKDQTQEQSVTTVKEKLKTLGEEISSIQATQSDFASQINNHITSERLQTEIEHLQSHIRECWDRLKGRIELQRQGLVSGVNQRVTIIHGHIAALSSGLNTISGEHERVVGHLANIAAPFRPPPYMQHIKHHLVDQNPTSPQPTPADDDGRASAYEKIFYGTECGSDTRESIFSAHDGRRGFMIACISVSLSPTAYVLCWTHPSSRFLLSLEQ
ncbi:hypothetical protein PTNB85_02030 [Pyrenophora teres f. teres]|nr:hypothetical protein HRS9139_00613 [Pyrenophora teres f. teres]KAE8848187.1 hypothetical protein PTNB85_02030 [Pyrenophora teres f. teres]KAE8868111.1 hypothetical protein PTNB29_02022 [Pyrenophora teres f. teres]